jgi:hypothetical protein
MDTFMKKLAVFALSFAAASAFANPNTGCGLGSQAITKQDSVLLQVVAVTLNGTSGNQTFGISSGTSGCAKPAKLVSLETQEFVAQNMDALAQDIAKGEGEALQALAKLMNVTDEAGFASALQANFDKVYTTASIDAATVLDNIAAVL